MDLIRLNQVRNHLKVLYVSDITEGNDKRIKASILNSLQNYTTTSDYGWRREIPVKKYYKLWRTAVNRLALDRFLPNKLGNWLQKSYNIKI